MGTIVKLTGKPERIADLFKKLKKGASQVVQLSSHPLPSPKKEKGSSIQSPSP
jgi:hypothetical protein